MLGNETETLTKSLDDLSPNLFQKMQVCIRPSQSTKYNIYISINIYFSFLFSQGVNDTIAFESLQYSLFSTTFVEVLGGVFFLLTAIFIIGDRRKAERASQGKH